MERPHLEVARRGPTRGACSLGGRLSKCSAYTHEIFASMTDGVFSMTCDDVQRYKYTEYFSTAEGRRRLERRVMFPPALIVLAIRAVPVVVDVAAGLTGAQATTGMAGAVATVVSLVL